MWYKHGKPDASISLADFKSKLEGAKKHLSPRQRAYLIVLYWLGCRRTEPLFLKREDIEEKDGKLFISISVREGEPYSRLKRGQAGGAIELPLSYYGVGLVKEMWKRTRKHRRLFPFSSSTAYRAVKRLYPKKTPHWFRYNRITKLRRRLGRELTIDEIKSFTGIRRDTTVQNYGLKTKAGIHKISTMLD